MIHLLNLYERWKNTGPPKEFEQIATLFSALSTKYCIETLSINNISEFKSFDYGHLYIMYLIGCAQGAQEGIDLKLIAKRPFEDYFHRLKSTRVIRDKRWTPFKEIRQNEIKEIKRQEKEKYKACYKHYHSDLESVFKKKPEFKHIP